MKSLTDDYKLDCEKKLRSRVKSIASPRNLGARWPAQRSLDLYAVRATDGATAAAGEQRAIVEGGEDGRTEGGRGEGLGEWSEWPRAALIGIIKPKLPSNPGRAVAAAREAQQVSGALDVCVVVPPRLRSVV